MKDLRGDAAASVRASASECFALVADIAGYPDWHPSVIRSAELTRQEHDGAPGLARATVHLGLGPLQRDFELHLEVSTVADRLVRLSRVPHRASDPEEFAVTWRIESGPDTRLAVELRASLEVPRLLPLQGVGDSVAQGFLAAAQNELARRAG